MTESELVKRARAQLDLTKQELERKRSENARELIEIKHPEDKKYDRLTIALSSRLKRQFLTICSKKEPRPSYLAEKLIAEFVAKNSPEDN